MRIRTISLAVAAAAILTLGLVSTSMAMHDGGVGHCDACHTMHNSLAGAPMTTQSGATQYNGLARLLKGADSSSTCLSCHSGSSGGSYRNLTTGMTPTTASPVPAQRSPGGDFAWLTYATSATNGQNRGHNIVAAGFNLVADTRFGGVSPGGAYATNQFYCTSCHDPHGKFRILPDGTVNNGIGAASLPIKASGSYADNTGGVQEALGAGYAVGTYRLLGGTGYDTAGGAAFTEQVPAALAPSTYNVADNAVPAGGWTLSQVRVAYGSNMSEWCSNCHANIHNDSYPGTKRHPTGNDGGELSTLADNYNAYVKTATLTGTSANSFINLVPFEIGAGQDTAGRNLMAPLVLSLGGPTATSNVSCLTCHRAHASGFASMMRWNHLEGLIAEEGEYTVRNGWIKAGEDAAYNDRPASQFANFQRSLCNKCHVKD